MASTKKPRHLFLSTNSDEDGKKPSKSAEWPLKAVAILLDIYVKKFAAGRGYLRGKDWEEVMTRVNGECEVCKTVKQCRDKVDSLKRRYKMEKRKAVNGYEVTWPFFTKLDDMMGSVFKQTRDFEPFDRQQKSSLYYSHDDGEEEADEDEKQDFSGSPEDYYGMENRRYNTPYYKEFLQNGKAKVEDRDAMSEEGFDLHTNRAPLKLLSLTGPLLSTDNSSGQHKHSGHPEPGATRKSHSGKRKVESQHPMRALADAVTGFSEVYARVELAKLEILTTMKLELAKLRRKRHKRCSRREQASSSSTSSG